MGKDLFDLSGKVAVVTGTSRGLGQYFARALARAGADLVITSRKLERLKEFKKEVEALGVDALPVELDVRDLVITSRKLERLKEFKKEVEALGVDALPLELDVRDLASMERCVERAHADYGRLDILVNNAGCNVRKPAVEVTWDDWNTVLETNLRGTFFMCQAVAKRAMIPQRYGRIINIGSVTCVFGYAGLAPYGASRGGVKQLTMSLADDWGIHGITVNCLAPGWFRTAQNEVLYQNRAWYEYICDRIPLKRPGLPNDLDGAVVFLASDASAYITGQTLLVDGGISTGATKATLDDDR